MTVPPIQGVLQPVVEGNVIGKFLMVLIPKKARPVIQRNLHQYQADR